jgi:hypothetical protein
MNDDVEVRNRLIKLAELLLARTREGKISWTPTDDERSFLYTASGTSAMINSTVTFDGRNQATLSVLNNRGTVIEKIVNEFSLRDETGLYVGEAPWNETLDDLYQAARRDALKITSLLDNFLANLEEEGGSQDVPGSTSTSDEPPF